MTNGNELSAVLTEAEQAEVQGKVMALLALQIKRYTGGESSSVPAELAQELLNSVCYYLHISAEQPDERWRRLVGRDADQLLKQRQSLIQFDIEHGKQLWERVCLHLPQAENISMQETLYSIGTFWRRYDTRYFAHLVPCDIDYQLAIPIAEQYQGIAYVNRYLERLTIENKFLRLFSAEKEQCLLERYSPDYRGLLINLFEPVLVNALGLTVLDEPVENLLFSPQLVQKLTDKLMDLDRQRIYAYFAQAGEKLTQYCGMQSRMERDYIAQNAALLAERVLAVRDMGGLTGMFL